jgi:hypothetical protein
MFKRGASGSRGDVLTGQQFQRTDGTGLVFEVVEAVASFGPPHLRVRRIDDPTDTRVFARSALMNRQQFRAVGNQGLPARGGFGQLRLSPT